MKRSPRTMAQAEKRVVRAAMRWYRHQDKHGMAFIEEKEALLLNACARLYAAQRKTP